MAIRSEEVMALNALLGLTGQVIDHVGKVKAIKTDAQLKRDELQFKIKSQQEANELELQKFAMQLALKKINDLDRKIETADAAFYEKTDLMYEVPPEKSTSTAVTVLKDMKNNNVSKWTQERGKFESEVKRKQRHLDLLKKESQKIDPVLNFIHRNYSSVAGGDSDVYSQEDYDATVHMAKEAHNITGENKYLQAAINKNTYSSQELIKLNADLSRIENQEERWKLTLGTATATAQKGAESKISSMAISFDKSENGDDSAVMLDLKDKISKARTDGTSLYGKTITSDDMEAAVIDDILMAVRSGDYWVLESMISDRPWVKQALQDLMPDLWLGYEEKKKLMYNIATEKPSKVGRKKKVKITQTIDSSTAIGNIRSIWDE